MRSRSSLEVRPDFPCSEAKRSDAGVEPTERGDAAPVSKACLGFGETAWLTGISALRDKPERYKAEPAFHLAKPKRSFRAGTLRLIEPSGPKTRPLRRLPVLSTRNSSSAARERRVRSAGMPRLVEAHRHAARTHDVAVRVHVEAAERWHDCGDEEQAALEERGAELEQMAANLENDRADLRASRIRDR